MLVEIVRQIEVEGGDYADSAEAFEKAGVDPAAGALSVQRLVRNGLLTGNATFGGGMVVDGVTERGLRESGAWPTAEQLTDRLIAAFEDAAEREPEPEKKGKFRSAAGALGGASRDIVVDVISGVITKSAGLG